MSEAELRAEVELLRRELAAVRESLGSIVAHGERAMSETDRFQLYVEVPKAAIKAGRRVLSKLAAEPKGDGGHTA